MMFRHMPFGQITCTCNIRFHDDGHPDTMYMYVSFTQTFFCMHVRHICVSEGSKTKRLFDNAWMIACKILVFSPRTKGKDCLLMRICYTHISLVYVCIHITHYRHRQTDRQTYTSQHKTHCGKLCQICCMFWCRMRVIYRSCTYAFTSPTTDTQTKRHISTHNWLWHGTPDMLHVLVPNKVIRARGESMWTVWTRTSEGIMEEHRSQKCEWNEWMKLPSNFSPPFFF